MSGSFDDKIKEKLAGYRKAPPGQAKADIFNQLNESGGNKSVIYYRIIAGVLIALALFEMGRIKESEPTEYIVDENVTQLSKEVPASGSQPFKEKDQNERSRLEIQTNRVAQKRDATAQSKLKTTYAAKDSESPQTREVQKRTFFSFTPPVKKFTITLDPEPGKTGLIAEKNRKNKIIPEQHKSLTPYFNLGTFFLYNRLQPNLDDEQYVSNYESPFALSGSRVGFLAEAGIQKRFSEILGVRLGVSLNSFSQRYSFSVRNTTPDSLSGASKDGYLQAHYHSEDINVEQRVTMIGLKTQWFWYLFNNHSNVLFGSLEYQRMLGRGPGFRYEGMDYSLMDPWQLLLEIGLRKRLFNFRKFNIDAMPGIRYGLGRNRADGLISVKPFSVGITISVGIE